MDSPVDLSKVADPLTETAKAVQEASKLGIEVTRVVGGGGRWLDAALGDTVRDVVGLLVGDRVHYARLRAAVADEVRLAEVIALAAPRIGRIPADRRRAIPPKIGLAWLEGASVEDESDLQAMWASLLATAIDAEEDPIDRGYVTILEELSLEDAVALEDYYESWTTLDEKPFEADGVTYGPGLDGEAYGDRVIANFHRLGLIEPGWIEIENYEPEQSNRYGVFGDTTHTVRIPAGLVTFRLTALGVAFCKAVGLSPGDPEKWSSLKRSEINRARR